MTENRDMEALLLRYFSGEATEEERTRVAQWVRESDEHARIARQIQELCFAADALATMEQVDTERALKRVQTRIFLTRIRRFVQAAERIAAVLFIPLLAAFLYALMASEETVEMMEVRTNPGMTTHIVLPDGTNVSLNSESSLRYPIRFCEDRKVWLCGEAFFDVTKDERKRFVVETTQGAKIEVHGTRFNLEAFPDDSLVVTTLLSGCVDFVSDAGHTRMQPNEKLVYHTGNGWMDKFTTTGEAETAWKDGRIVFRNTPFEEALHMLEKRYYVDFVVTNPRYAKDAFTGSFTNQRLDRILEIFQISSGIRWRYVSTGDKADKKSKIEIY